MNEGRKVFITGASSGIGLAVATLLCAKGFDVWGTARSVSRLPVLARFHPVVLDLNEPEGMAAAFETAALEAGGFDILINNAGDVVNAPLEALVRNGLRAQMETLFFGPLELIRLALPGMRRRNTGVIVNVTSLAVQFPIPFNAGYSAAKAALSSCSECLRLELTGTGIRVVDVQPGDVATEILRRTRELNTAECDSYEPNLSRSRAAEAGKMEAACLPEKVASLILALLSAGAPPPRVAVGNFFEAKVATLTSRVLSRRMVEKLQRWIYKLS
ncbi:MAG: short-chain alcohol dehydrogenase family [Verrucomicrobia bacterium]|nr:MAG: short-chain alcohol dehydrogenase family [Verrucomicrobiota bacterium]